MFSIGHLVYSHYKSEPSLISRERVFSKGRAISIALDIVTGVALGVIGGLALSSFFPPIGIVNLAMLTVWGGYLALTLLVNLIPIAINSCHSQQKDRRPPPQNRVRESDAFEKSFEEFAKGRGSFEIHESPSPSPPPTPSSDQKEGCEKTNLIQTSYHEEHPKTILSILLPKEPQVLTGPIPLKFEKASKEKVLSEPYQMRVQRLVDWEGGVDINDRVYGGICESCHNIILPDESRKGELSKSKEVQKNIKKIKVLIYDHHFGIYTTDKTEKLAFFALFKTDVEDPAIELKSGRIKIQYDYICKTLRLVVQNPEFNSQRWKTSEKDKKINVQWVSSA